MATILIIDDDKHVLDLFQDALRMRGHEVYTAANADAGMAFVKACDFDIVICDMFLPDRDGFDVLRAIRNVRPHQKVIISTGGGSFGMLDVLDMAEQFGADATFSKTDGIDMLAHTVGRVVSEMWTPAGAEAVH